MDNKIYNYSFHPVTEYALKLGIIELEERVSFVLKENFDFEYPPTPQEIIRKCKNIIQHAVKNNHRSVFIRNYESFQSDLITEFQKNGIRVFVPVYYKYNYTESRVGSDLINHISYLKIDHIKEVSIKTQPELTQATIILSQKQSSYELFIKGELKSGISIRLDIVQGTIVDIFDWFQSFISHIKSIKIQDYLSSNYGVIFTEYKDFTNGLIQVLKQLGEELTNNDSDKYDFNNEKLEDMINLIEIISVIDSDEVQEYTALTEYAVMEFNKEKNREIILLNKAYNLYIYFESKTQSIVAKFDTKPFVKLGIQRSFNLSFNIANLFQQLAKFQMRNGLFMDSEINYMKSADLYGEYHIGEISDEQFENSTFNLILVQIILGKHDLARSSIDNILGDVDKNDRKRVILAKEYLSTIYRNTGKYDLALEINNELISFIDKKSNIIGYYMIEVRNSLIFYLSGKTADSLEMLREIISCDSLPTVVKSYAIYLYNLILFVDRKRISEEDLIVLSHSIDENKNLEMYYRLIEILGKITRKESNIDIKDKLEEFIYLYPQKKIMALILLSPTYIIEKNWNSLSEVFDHVIFSTNQHPSIIRIKLYLCKFYLSRITGAEDLIIKGLIQEIASQEKIDISAYEFEGSTDYAIEQLKSLLELDLVKLENRIY